MRLALLALVILALLADDITAQTASAAVPSVCNDVRYLMANDLTPYDLQNSGSILQPNTPLEAAVEAGEYSQFYALNAEPAPLTLTFADVTPELELEYAVFRGMEQISPYQPVFQREPFTLEVTESGVYTVVVRRVQIAQSDIVGEYTLTAAFAGGGSVAQPDLRNDTTSQIVEPQPTVADGTTTIPLPDAEVRAHVAAVTSVATPEAVATQVRYGQNGVLVGEWADQIALLGGDFAARGANRILFLQTFGYAENILDATLSAVVDANDTSLTINWTDVRGVWLLDRCAGLKLNDGRAFTAPVNPENRSVTFSGTLADFDIRVNSLDADGNPLPFSLDLDWAGIAEDSEVTFADGLLNATFTGDKVLTLQASQIELTRREAAQAFDFNLPQQSITLTLDWAYMSAFTLRDAALTIAFTDEQRGTITRPAEGLARFEALDDVIEIVYQGEGQQPGEHRLLLPDSESYLEIITPAGLPTFDSLALPDQPGVRAPGLNNLGGECYPVNTLLEQANCPPNGEFNPANGNLWYAVTDLSAHGGFIDLMLNRSYNSAASDIDGPFGFGWTTAYLLDYNMPFNPETGTRPVTPETLYRVGLDLTWAPRGLVTFSTPSGSQHVFTTGEGEFGSGTLMAITMPGFTLERDSLRDPNWTLTQTDGLTYEFDRAGRLLRYGYPARSRMIEVTYPRTTLDGLVGETVVVTDAPGQRQLELVYNNDARIERAVLRDLTQPDSAPLETLYRYTEGRLTEVVYADGETAAYTYDARGRMTGHIDPRAPIAATMRYTYGDDGAVSAEITTGAEPLPWQALAPPQITDSARAVTVTDDLGNRRTYTYALEAATPLRAAGNAYTLTSVTSPLSDSLGIDGLPATYIWQNGLLTDIGAKLVEAGGRNSTTFRYTPGGEIAAISGGYLGLDIAFDEDDAPLSVNFADQTGYAYTYNADGLPATVTDRQGAVYSLTYNANGWVTRRIRQNDGVTWDYTYNPLGLVTNVVRNGYEVRYTWDGLGRLTGVDDPLTGAHSLTYTQGEADCEHAAIRVRDVLGSTTLVCFDAVGRLAEQRLTIGETVLRRTTYAYDVLNRVTGVSVWVDDQPLTTSYRYTPVQILPFQEGDEGQRLVINGYSVTVADPVGRQTTHTYDALNRLRQVEDQFGAITRYDYSALETGQTNGLRVVQRDLRGGELFRTTTYTFDLRWQLRSLIHGDDEGDITYTFSSEGDPVRLRFLQAPGAGIASLTWSEYQGTRATDAALNPVGVPLVSGAPIPSPELNTATDFLGRVVSRTDGNGEITTYAYCPLPEGAQRVLIGAESCDSTTFTQALIYDARERLTRVEDTYGTRTYTYTIDGSYWLVEVDFGGAYRWQLRYNAAGDLMQWTDDNGTTRDYTYDTAGRLRAVTVADDPEASITYDYNAAGLLVRIVDGLGRGSFFQYDVQGSLIVQQDVLTADATTYAYGPYGELISVTSPLGSSTVYQYTDPNDPQRLTAIIDPSGNVEQFVWRDAENSLTYIDPRGSQIRYVFDVLGALWRVDDATGQSYELRYDAAGKLRDLVAVLSPEATAQHFTLNHIEDGIAITETSQPDWDWLFNFDPAGNITRVQDPADQGEVFAYDSLGRLASAGITTIERVQSEKSLTLNDQVITFDNLYRLRSQRDELRGETIVNYNTGRRGDVIIQVGERTYTFSPGDDSAQPRTVRVDSPGKRQTMIYNAEGLIEELREDVCIDSVTPTCIDEGSLLWTTTTRFVYDLQGRPIRVIDAEQNVETFAYDEAGNLITYQSSNGKTYAYTYDALHRLVSLTTPTGLKLVLAHDALDRVTGICRTRASAPDDYAACVEAGGEIETYTYNTLRQLLTQQFPSVAVEDDVSTATHVYTRGRLNSWETGENGAVIRLFTPNGLLSRLLLDSGEEYGFDYSGGRVASINGGGAAAYGYDSLGQLNRVTAGDYTLNYAHDENGYTVATSDARLSFGLDERGLLTALGYAAVLNDEETIESALSFRYNVNPRDPNVLGAIGETREAANTLDLQLNRLNRTQNLALNFFDRLLLLDYLTLPLGQISRQRIDGNQTQLFAADADGYVTVLGYNDDDRPSTMRVNSKTSGELLYVLNFTYNDNGQRASETRRYADNTQMIIRYEYGTPNQLTRRVVEIVRGETLLNFMPLALIAPLLWALRHRRRRFALLCMVIGGACFAGFEAQRRQEVYSYLYRYDTAGNLIGIDYENPATNSAVVCSEFAYDSLNRLTRVTRGERQYLYRYDAYNRVVEATNWSLVYDSDTPVMAYNRGGVTVYYGRVDGQPPLFTGSGQDTTYLLPDGQGHILTTTSDETVNTPLRLFDPLGRQVALLPPLSSNQLDPCSLTPDLDSADLPQQPVPAFEGMLWDTQADIYFDTDGRAYLPSIGRYLQRRLLGPDVYGNVYEYTGDLEPSVPRLRTQHDDKLFGLRRLVAAQQQHSLQLDAAAVLVSQLPAPRSPSTWAETLAQPAPIMEPLEHLVNLPYTLQTRYNLPGAQLDPLTGALQLDQSRAPGQGDTGTVQFDLPMETQWLPTTPAAPLARLRGLIDDIRPTVPVAASYQSLAWVPIHTASIWDAPVPSLSPSDTPAAILDELPQPLERVETVIPMLDIVQGINALPEATTQAWVEAWITAALPTPPQLPPVSVEAWRTRWFDTDILGTADALADRYALPPLPSVPVYRIGTN